LSDQRTVQSAKRYVVTRVDELQDGERLIVDVDGRSIGVFNEGGEFHAILNRCPHQGGPLCLGDVLDLVEATAPGEYRVDLSVKVLSCPWHGWEFDLRSGRSYFDPSRTRVKAYRVDVADSQEINSDVAVSSASYSKGRHPGPYKAEVIPVTVEGEYLVITLTSGSNSTPASAGP
jgi:3-phenylpropionate/trans-cinnamate dioxygenase ferredoxin subunit